MHGNDTHAFEQENIPLGTNIYISREIASDDTESAMMNKLHSYALTLPLYNEGAKQAHLAPSG